MNFWMIKDEQNCFYNGSVDAKPLETWSYSSSIQYIYSAYFLYIRPFGQTIKYPFFSLVISQKENCDAWKNPTKKRQSEAKNNGASKVFSPRDQQDGVVSNFVLYIRYPLSIHFTSSLSRFTFNGWNIPIAPKTHKYII